MRYLSDSGLRVSALSTFAAVAFLFFTGSGKAVTPDTRDPNEINFAHILQGQRAQAVESPTVQAAAQPRMVKTAQRPETRRKRRIRGVRSQTITPAASRAQAAAQEPAAEQTPAEDHSMPANPISQTSLSGALVAHALFWPDNQAAAGINALFPVVIKTVREMAEENGAVADAEVVLPNELSDLDLAAGPAPEPQVAQVSTDGRAQFDTDQATPSPGRFSAVMESLKALPQARWFEPVLLMMAGAIAAVSAARIFAR